MKTHPTDLMTTDPRVENINANLAAIGKRIDALQAACKMTLLFHSASPWDASKRIQWNELRREVITATDGKGRAGRCGEVSEEHPHLGPWTLLNKTPPGTCLECAVKHDPAQPHNAQSLPYQYGFYGKQGRWPTWADAMAHCSPEVKTQWTEALKERGVIV